MKNSENIRKVIAIIELFGGVMGLFIIIPLVAVIANLLASDVSLSIKTIDTVIFVFATCLYILSIIAGVALWKKSKNGMQLSLFVQGFQIPGFIVPHVSYFFVSGLAIVVSSNLHSNFFVTFYLSRFNIYLTPGATNFVLGLNIIALVAFINLWREKTRIKD